MAVIFAVVGAGVVVGGIAASDSYSDYDDYDNYGDYSNYSDEAERRKRRQAEKQREIDTKKCDINSYKSQSVNQYLQTNSLIQQSGVDVSVSSVKNDGDSKIQSEQNRDFSTESTSLQDEISTIDDVIYKIDNILEEE